MNHLFHLLQEYQRQSDDEDWYCATVVTKSGSSYRRPGAMMLVNPWGKSYGLVSGGCLESDVVHRAQRVRQSGEAEYVIYDTEDEDSFAANLGLGCNGKIGVLIQAVTPAHRTLLQTLHQRMQTKQESYLLQCYQSMQKNRLGDWVLLDQSGQILACTNPALGFSELEMTSLKNHLPEKQSVQLLGDNYWSVARISPPVNLWVLGGGLDAQPMVEIAATLGWLVTVVDHRAGYAREAYFAKAHRVLHLYPDQLTESHDFHSADAFICMTHNKNLDAAWMRQLQGIQRPAYISILGPATRKHEVMTKAGADQNFSAQVIGPAGLAIGGDLPESIALSILSECHAAIFNPAAVDLKTPQLSLEA
jgi:xanthine dehydrogenase accessory factor